MTEKEHVLKTRRRGRSLNDYKEDLYLCARCGYCRSMVRARDGTDLVCPIRENTGGFDSFTARGRNIIARGILEGKIDFSKPSRDFIDSLYTCTLCGSCQEHCLALDDRSWDRFPHNKFTDHKVDILGINEALRSLIIEKGIPPIVIRQVLQNIDQHGNPEGRPRSQRDAFTNQLDFPIKRAKDGECETLFYVGSVASYNERNQRMAQAIVKILYAADIDFCIFGNEEEDSGAHVLRIGEVGLFEELAQRNSELIRSHGIRHLICLSPHDYDAFLNDYPAFLEKKWTEQDLKIQHYSELLLDLIRSNNLRISHKFNRSVTFQDPCYLGRINNLHDAPREVLQAVGAKLVEMKMSRRNSYCCGGGGGGIWHDPLHKPRLENERATQACETCAEIIAVTCPICAQMLETGLNSIENCDLQVLDIAEIVLETIDFK